MQPQLQGPGPERQAGRAVPQRPERIVVLPRRFERVPLPRLHRPELPPPGPPPPPHPARVMGPPPTTLAMLWLAAAAGWPESVRNVNGRSANGGTKAFRVRYCRVSRLRAKWVWVSWRGPRSSATTDKPALASSTAHRAAAAPNPTMTTSFGAGAAVVKGP